MKKHIFTTIFAVIGVVSATSVVWLIFNGWNIAGVNWNVYSTTDKIGIAFYLSLVAVMLLAGFTGTGRLLDSSIEE